MSGWSSSPSTRRRLDYLLRRLRATHEEDRILTLHGSGGTDGMDQQARDRVKDAFNDPTHQVRLLLATDAAAEGLNLPRAPPGICCTSTVRGTRRGSSNATAGSIATARHET